MKPAVTHGTVRDRKTYALAIVIVITLGLASRLYGSALPRFVAMYAGDTLWAIMVFLVAACLWRSASTALIAIGVALFALLVEVSQLDQTSWFARLRATRVVGLFLGSDFIWTDLVCYAVGIGVGIILDRWLIRAAE